MSRRAKEPACLPVCLRRSSPPLPRYYPQRTVSGGLVSRQSSPPPPTRSLPPSRPASPPPASSEPHPKPSEDRALTAFAQLGALRLNTQRCVISFFDRKHCYILAEATKSLSLHSGQPEFSHDSLYWGNSIFAKEKSICYYTVNLAPVIPGLAFEDLRSIPALVVGDLSKDRRFKDFSAVAGQPYSRFYAGVPIRSPRGHNIGTYCVLDDKPRDGLSAHELEFLRDMAGTVMRHLEMTRATEDQRRGKIMVKSLGSFAEGKTGLEDWWQDPWDTPPSAGLTDTISVQRQRQSTVSSATQETLMFDRRESSHFSVPAAKSTTPSPGFHSPSHPTPTSEVATEVPVPDTTTNTATSGQGEQKDKIAPEVRAAFTRAANMIVDATEADGAAFFDAKISTFGGLVDDDFVSEQLPEPDKPCVLLGSALSKTKQGSMDQTEAEYSMSESILRHLLRSYSHGQIFNFDDDEPSAPINSPSGYGDFEACDGFPFHISRKSESTRSLDDENFLRSVFPKAKSLVLYPLWDPHRDRWFASAIIWSSDPMRVFTSEQELSYLSAFSNSVMAEVARLDTKLADAAKADFISSISHELRSPLHGILGMTDLLKDSHLDSQQISHIQTIETCGKTLLETINHVSCDSHTRSSWLIYAGARLRKDQQSNPRSLQTPKEALTKHQANHQPRSGSYKRYHDFD